MVDLRRCMIGMVIEVIAQRPSRAAAHRAAAMDQDMPLDYLSVIYLS
jgi:hypothetical protein